MSEPVTGRVTRTGSYCTPDGVESGTVESHPAIGIPYAMDDLDTDARICPVCDARIPERYDAVGERLTNNYAEHYQQAHA